MFTMTVYMACLLASHYQQTALTKLYLLSFNSFI